MFYCWSDRVVCEHVDVRNKSGHDGERDVLTDHGNFSIRTLVSYSLALNQFQFAAEFHSRDAASSFYA